MANCKKEHSLRSLSDRYKTNYETLRQLKKQGIDLLDENAVIGKLSENPAYIPPETNKDNPPLNIPSENKDKGLRAAIERLRDSEISAYENYRDSLKNNPALSGRFLKEWQTILEALRKVEESNPDIEEANSNSISREELAKTLGTLFKNLRQDLEALPEKISTIGQNTAKQELKKIAAAETNRIIDSLFSWKGFNE